MKTFEYEDYWFNYILTENPQIIKKTIKEKYITSNGLKIHLDIYENEDMDDKTIVFVHGTSVYSRFYAEFCYKLFKKGYRVVAPDLIGHGLSEGKRGHFTMEKFTKTIYDVISHVIEGYGENTIVMGSSLGGITALYCAAYDPRLKGVICHNAAIFNEKAYKRLVKSSIKLFLPLIPIFAKILPKLKLSVFLYLDFNKLAKSKFVDKIDMLLNDKVMAFKYTLTSLRAQIKEPMAKPIELIEIPVMIINGDKDYLFSVEYMKELFNRLTCRNKKLEILSNTSHLIFQENIEDVLERIIPWVEKIL